MDMFEFSLTRRERICTLHPCVKNGRSGQEIVFCGIQSSIWCISFQRRQISVRFFNTKLPIRNLFGWNLVDQVEIRLPCFRMTLTLWCRQIEIYKNDNFSSLFLIWRTLIFQKLIKTNWYQSYQYWHKNLPISRGSRYPILSAR